MSSSKPTLERTLETPVELVDLARKQQKAGFEETKASIDALALNIGQLAQQQKLTAANIDRLSAAIERQNAAIDGHLRLSEAQSVNIAELTRLATKLIDRAA